MGSGKSRLVLRRIGQIQGSETDDMIVVLELHKPRKTPDKLLATCTYRAGEHVSVGQAETREAALWKATVEN